MRTEGPGVAFFEHTADIGLEIRGETLEDLYRWAAVGFREIVLGRTASPLSADRSGVGAGASGQTGGSRTKVHLSQAPDPEALLVDWLNFLLYTFETERRLPGDRHWVLEVKGEPGKLWSLDGWFEGLLVTPGMIVTVVKGATLHGLEITLSGQGLYHARVVLDI